MKINFETPRYTPCFKAHFANDKQTNITLKKMIKEDPVSTLALKLALEDSIDSAEIYARQLGQPGPWYSGGSIDTFELLRPDLSPRAYSAPEATSPSTLLENVCENEKRYCCSHSFLKYAPKKSPIFYIKKAKKLINANNDANLIERQKMLNKQISDLQKELDTINKDLKNTTEEFVKKEIL